jgi:hypothetical protein
MRPIFLAPIFTGILLLSGCSQFERDWEAAAAVKPADSTDITGRWQGTWSSDASGHNGGLRCLMTRINSKTYHARYAATYFTILHFSYEMDLSADRMPEWVKFEGEADLGAMAGGVYHYEGHANAENFYATYRSNQDHGRFTMKRPE